MVQIQLLVALLVISVTRQTQSQRLGCSNSDYTYLGSKCYKTVFEPGNTYGEAKSVCESDGGRLAVMATPAEAIAVLSSIALASSDDVILQHGLWIGLNDRKEENVYEWEDGRQVAGTIDLFGEGEGPNNPVVCEDCGRIQQNMWWTMWSCKDTSGEGYVCEMVTDCPSTGLWIRFRSKCFHLAKTSDEVNYFHAQGLCQQQHVNSNLAKIESVSELNHVVRIMSDAGLGSNDTLWFGATDFVSENSFVYPDGSAARPLEGSYVFSAANKDRDFLLLKQNEWLTEAWNYGDASGYVCSIDLDCQFSWQTTDGLRKSCYTFSAVEMPWHSAKEECSNGGMHLLALETTKEQQFIKQQFEDEGLNVWTGANSLSGSWQWEGINPPLNLSSFIWGSNAPYGFGPCGYLFNAFDGLLYDWGCNNPLSYICEFQLS
ncbi:hypothetical protein CAPTEDRAFT_189871 [Capitella teleta]|uniref:C-type lectin domain-containing protein n=1 Tax=Capitella teleta TaxID=283909 RepID=R7USQ3_CAPTE|nr:hypothetical protein CAPTEDRAFT_189871 [Capitella teleta]|eukprot:ELU09168.1 hypothetical protein CAPTEDRAFT_189871 [Capitella teleta]